ELSHKAAPIDLHLLYRRLLDWPETSNSVRKLCQFHSNPVVGRLQPLLNFGQEVFVVGNQLTLQPALSRMPEGIEECSPQLSQRHQQSHCLQHPGAIGFLSWPTGVLVVPCQQRRRQMDLDLVVALELGSDPLEEAAVAIEPSHLILVLV